MYMRMYDLYNGTKPFNAAPSSTSQSTAHMAHLNDLVHFKVLYKSTCTYDGTNFLTLSFNTYHTVLHYFSSTIQLERYSLNRNDS